ncbi:MAG: hypothetical protein Tsb0021_04150 [Chlamydiales bacterium]
MRRIPRNYDGTRTTTKHTRDILGEVIEKIEKSCLNENERIKSAWPLIIGEKLAPMTSVAQFKEGIVYINVKNATLYSLLQQHEKQRLLQKFKQKFSKTAIHNIIFRIG